jgi:hypothetical protein
MQTFIVDRDNKITELAGESMPQTDGLEAFSTRDELGKLAAGWPMSRLVELWNKIPGLAPIKKFTDRETALTRIWKAVQGLAVGATEAHVATEAAAPENQPTALSKGTQPKKRARKAKARKPKAAGREGTKTACMLALLQQSEGATLTELMRATRWQAHSVRGFLSGAVAKKMGLAVESARREDGERVYKIVR